MKERDRTKNDAIKAKYRRLKSINSLRTYDPQFETSFSNFSAAFSSLAFDQEEHDLFSRASELHGKIRRVYLEKPQRVSELTLASILDLAAELINQRKQYHTIDYLQKLDVFKELGKKIRHFPFGKVISAAISAFIGVIILGASGLMTAIGLGLIPPMTLIAGFVLSATYLTAGIGALGAALGIGTVMTSGMLLYKSATKLTLVRHMDRFKEKLKPHDERPAKKLRFERNAHFEQSWNKFGATFAHLATDSTEQGFYSAAAELHGKINRLYMEQHNRFSPALLAEILDKAGYLVSERKNYYSDPYQKELKSFVKLESKARQLPYGKILGATIFALAGAAMLIGGGILLAIGLGYMPPLALLGGFVASQTLVTIEAAAVTAITGFGSMILSGMLVFKASSKATLVKHMEAFEFQIKDPIFNV